MTTTNTKQSQGEDLINIISANDKQKAYEQCISSIEQYRLTAFPPDSNTLTDEVYDFLNQRHYCDSIFEYSYQSAKLLKAFAQPKVNAALIEALGESWVKDLSNMIYRLHDFTDTLNDDRFKSLFELIEISEYLTAENKTVSQWNQITEAYDRKLQALMIIKGIAKAVPISEL